MICTQCEAGASYLEADREELVVRVACSEHVSVKKAEEGVVVLFSIPFTDPEKDEQAYLRQREVYESTTRYFAWESA